MGLTTLTDNNMDVLIYALGDHRMTVPGSAFAQVGACCPSCGPVAGLVVVMGLVGLRRPRSCRNGGQAG